MKNKVKYGDLPLPDLSYIRRKFARCKTEQEATNLYESIQKHTHISDLQMPYLRSIYERRIYTLKQNYLRLKGRNRDNKGKFIKD